MNPDRLDLMGRRRRRRHSAEFKVSVIEQSLKLGVSNAAVALSHGLNANGLRKRVIDGEHKIRARASPAAVPAPEPTPVPSPTFIPLALPAPVVDGDIRIQLQRVGTTVRIGWPAAAARDCAAWLRDWLQ